jgi:glutamine---fructose-6-phosphate transaminase (isomerizing)
MCGILSVAGEEGWSSVQLIQRLQRLEYRGYDSFGLGDYEGERWRINKYVGKVSDFLEEPSEDYLLKVALSHTRWATHGEVNEANTHPHMSYDNALCLVHNGVVENYQQLRGRLRVKDIECCSQTDTEVIANLLAYTLNQVTNFTKATLLEGLQICLRQLKGSYAFVFMHKEEPEKLYYAKKGSPLLLGKGEGATYISSDIYTFIDETDKVMYLNDGDYGCVDAFNALRYNLRESDQRENKWTRVTASYAEVELGDYQHYMIKEICEQRNIIKNTVENQSLNRMEEVVDLIEKARRVVFSACGSSYYASMIGSHFLGLRQIMSTCVLSSEFDSQIKTLNSNDLVVCVSQSGETADIIESIKLAKKQGCKVLSVVNVLNSTVDRISDFSIYLNAGPEICVLSTKSFTSQVALFMLLDKLLDKDLPVPQLGFGGVESHIYNLVAESTRNSIRSIAEVLYEKDHLYCLGRGVQYPVALEAALKIKEVSYIHAEGFAGGELKHGSIALIEEGTPCILFIAKEHELELLANGSELKSRGALIIGVAPEPNELFDYFIRVNECEIIAPFLQIIPIQLLAYNLALLKGLDPDKPRNLAKSVTVK